MFSYLDDHANALITSTQQSRPAPPSTRLSPLPPEPADFYNDFATPVDIPMDTNRVGCYTASLRSVLWFMYLDGCYWCESSDLVNPYWLLNVLRTSRQGRRTFWPRRLSWTGVRRNSKGERRLPHELALYWKRKTGHHFSPSFIMILGTRYLSICKEHSTLHLHHY